MAGFSIHSPRKGIENRSYSGDRYRDGNRREHKRIPGGNVDGDVAWQQAEVVRCIKCKLPDTDPIRYGSGFQWPCPHRARQSKRASRLVYVTAPD